MMAKYGYNLGINDIVEAGKKIREEAGPIAGTAMSHTEVRMEAIRREMERKMLEKKLQECAEDWATEVESLTAPLRHSAEAWAKSAVSESVVESIYLAWERERHQSAERNLYPEVVEALQKIKADHPNVIVGAVTDGKANPMLMVFSLAPYFDFCMSWEDDANGRADFFKELGNVDGNADLQWIYKAGKSALVLFYYMNSCVQYEVSTTWLFYLTLVCLFYCLCKSHALTYVSIISCHLNKM